MNILVPATGIACHASFRGVVIASLSRSMHLKGAIREINNVKQVFSKRIVIAASLGLTVDELVH
jgi:hypothetical protein